MSKAGNYLVAGEVDGLVSQVLLALHTGCHPKHCTVLCRRDGDLPRFWAYACGHMESAFDGLDDESLVPQLNRLCESYPGLVAIPADCAGAELLYRLLPRLTIDCVPFPDPGMLARFDDKWSFHCFCRAEGLPVPQTLRLDHKHALDFEQMASRLGTPVVVKPLREQASTGLKLISGKDQWQREVLANAAYQFAPLVAQRYIAGTDIGINLLAVHGELRALAMQQRDFPQTAGARIRFFHDSALEEKVRQLCQASRYHGVMNIDARVEVGTGNTFFLESNPRFWQSLGASAWCGMNFVEKCCAPPAALDDRNRLTSGTADTYHHPLFRPALLAQGLLSRHAHRRTMARLMLLDIDLLRRGLKDRLRDKPLLHALLRKGQRSLLSTMRRLRQV